MEYIIEYMRTIVSSKDRKLVFGYVEKTKKVKKNKAQRKARKKNR